MDLEIKRSFKSRWGSLQNIRLISISFYYVCFFSCKYGNSYCSSILIKNTKRKNKKLFYPPHTKSMQVTAAGDLCAICQEKMHAPVLLSCKHIFCEDCVSEWFERERTCPLCRALVKPSDLRSFSDGSTSLFFQLF